MPVILRSAACTRTQSYRAITAIASNNDRSEPMIWGGAMTSRASVDGDPRHSRDPMLSQLTTPLTSRSPRMTGNCENPFASMRVMACSRLSFGATETGFLFAGCSFPMRKVGSVLPAGSLFCSSSFAGETANSMSASIHTSSKSGTVSMPRASNSSRMICTTYEPGAGRKTSEKFSNRDPRTRLASFHRVGDPGKLLQTLVILDARF